MQSVNATEPLGDWLFCPPQLRHVVSTDAPTVVEYLPAPQLVHEDSTDTPVVEEYLPAPQSVHGALLMDVLYLPATQAVHVCPSRPVVPALHRQSVRDVEPRDEFEFAGQFWHVRLPISDHVPASHVLQVSMPVAPLAEEYKPPGHFEHSYRLVTLS